jgi:hypothetical protein
MARIAASAAASRPVDPVACHVVIANSAMAIDASIVKPSPD